jgi:hypothetical protein
VIANGKVLSQAVVKGDVILVIERDGLIFCGGFAVVFLLSQIILPDESITEGDSSMHYSDSRS